MRDILVNIFMGRWIEGFGIRIEFWGGNRVIGFIVIGGIWRLGVEVF